jgi:hypothetical protein
MKFNSADIFGLLTNNSDIVGSSLRAIDDKKKVIVSQGYGITDKGLPLRALAYLVPILRLLNLLPSNVMAEIYLVKAGVLRANHLDTLAIERNFELLKNLICLYTSSVHGNLDSRIRILYDSTPEPDINQLIENLVLCSQPMIEDEPAIKSFLEKRGDKASRYMVEHLIYMRDPIDFGLEPRKVKLVPGMSMDMAYLIMVGGPSEKIFYRFRSKLMTEFKRHNLWQSLQFFTPIGAIPTYHLQEGETTWQDKNLLPDEVTSALRQMVQYIDNEYGAKKDVLRDMVYLLLDAGGSTNFNTGGALKVILNNGVLPDDFRNYLQAGWDFIRKF